jgi:hypothetical protein
MRKQKALYHGVETALDVPILSGIANYGATDSLQKTVLRLRSVKESTMEQ